MPELKVNRPGQDRRLCQCGECKEFFASLVGFDRHRVGPYDTGRRCLSPAEMVSKKKMVLRDGVWHMPGKINPHWAKAEPVGDEA